MKRSWGKRWGSLTVPGAATEESTDDMIGLRGQAEPTAAQPIDAIIEQRPNAVIRNGGPQLLRGLMLPLPPSSNAYWDNVLLPKKGLSFPFMASSMRSIYANFRTAKVPTPESKAYCKTIGELALQRNFRFFTAKPLRMDVLVCPRDRRSIDAHNYTKVLFDALEQAGVYEDDSQIDDSRTRLGPIMPGGRVVISLWEIEPNRDQLLTEMWR